jgi:hypothetical protein
VVAEKTAIAVIMNIDEQTIGNKSTSVCLAAHLEGCATSAVVWGFDMLPSRFAGPTR